MRTKKYVAALSLAAIVGFLAFLQPDAGAATGPLQYNVVVSATSVNSTVTIPFAATSIRVINNSASANSVFLSTTGVPATVAVAGTSFEIIKGEVYDIPAVNSELEPGRTRIDLICNAAETATVRVMAVR